MMEFVTEPLSELLINFDSKRIPLSSRERESKRGSYPYYGATSVLDYVDEYIFDGTYILLGEDGTVINEDGSPVLQLANGKFWCNNHAHILKNTDKVDFYFLYYLLKNCNVTSIVTGAVQPKISQKNLYSFIVTYPKDKSLQRKIVSILKTIDDKIELNQRQNNNLEQQAQALFKSWFIDFEPFGGVMPEDWKVGKVDEIIELFDSQRIPLSGNQRENMQKLYPYYGATSLMDYVDNYIFDGKYLLLGEDGTVIDNEGFPILQYVWGKFWVNNHAHILQGKNGFNVESLYLFFKKTNIKSIVTGAVQPKVNQANLRAIPAIIPNLECMNKFNKIIDPLFAMLRNNKEENTRLAAIRDALLPKLMSGEIDVSNVDISALTSADKLSFTEE